MIKNLFITILAAVPFSVMGCGYDNNDNKSDNTTLMSDDIKNEVKDTISIKTGKFINFSPDIFGFNTQTAAGPSWSDPEFMNRLKELRPGNLRYPGGTIGNYLDWRTGQYMEKDMRDPEGLPPRRGIKGPGGSDILNTYRLEELSNGIHATDACPVFMLNMLTDNLQGSIDMLSHAKDLGLKIKYVELGNEFYLSYTQGGKAPDQLGDYTKSFHYPTAESYAKEAKLYVTKLKQLYPEALFAYNAVIDKPDELWFNSSTRTVSWNETMKNADIGADAVILHLYTGSASSPEALIDNTIKEINDFNEFTKNVFPDTDIWVTEYNIKCDMKDKNSYRNAYAGQWIHGINSVLMTAELIMLPQVSLLCFHDIAAGVPSAVVFAEDAQIPVSQGSSSYKTAKALSFSASGYAFTLLGYAMDNANEICRISIEDNDSDDNVYGWLFKGKNNRMLVINLSSDIKVVPSEIPDISSKADSIIQYSATSLTDVIYQDTSLKKTETKISEKFFSIEPYSIAVISF